MLLASGAEYRLYHMVKVPGSTCYRLKIHGPMGPDPFVFPLSRYCGFGLFR